MIETGNQHDKSRFARSYKWSTRQTFCINLEKEALMKKYSILWLYAMALVMTLTSCEVVGGIFKAGFWTAIILIVLVVGLILWLVGRGRR